MKALFVLISLLNFLQPANAKSRCDLAYSQNNNIFQMCLGVDLAKTNDCALVNDNTSSIARAYCLGKTYSKIDRCNDLNNGSLARSVCLGVKFSTATEGCGALYGTRAFAICIGNQYSKSDQLCNKIESSSESHPICIAFALSR